MLVFLGLSYSVFAQTMFEYERKTDNKEKYYFSEIRFTNEAENHILSRTLFTPQAEFDKIIIIIVPGSGKDRRYAHFILAEKLLENNNAIFSFDERGIGLSKVTYSELVADLFTDLVFADKELKRKFSNKKIVIIGHSIDCMAVIEIIKNGIVPFFLIFIEAPIVKNRYFSLKPFKNNFEESLPEVICEGKTKDELISFFEGYFKVVQKIDFKSLKKEVKAYIREKNFDKKLIVLLDDVFLTEMIKTDLEECLRSISLQTLYLTGTKDKTINYNNEINKI